MEMTESKFGDQEKQRLILSAQDLRSGKLVESLPEFYELKDSVENSEDGWHQQEPVFDHTLSVMEALEKVFIDNNNLEAVFDKKIDNYSRKDLLEIAAAFHDIGKKEAMAKEGEFTKCAGHEKISVEKTKAILERFNLSHRENELVLDIIANHSVFHHLLNPDNPNFQNDLEDLHNRFGESIYPELIVLSYADTVNSKLKIVRPDEFKHRIAFYKKETEAL
jgi:UTP:GlnB (protein PII) uridylyltransferase